MSKFNTTCNTKVSFTIGEVRHVLSIEDARTLIKELQNSMSKAKRNFRTLGKQTADVMEDEECLYVMVGEGYAKRTIQAIIGFHIERFVGEQFDTYNGHPMFKNLSDAQEYMECLNNISRADRMLQLWIPSIGEIPDMTSLVAHRRSISERGVTITI